MASQPGLPGLIEQLGLLGRGEFVLYTAYALIFVTAFLIAQIIVKSEDARTAEENLEQKDRKNATDPLVKVTRPFFSQYVVPTFVRGRKFWENSRKVYKRKLISGGLKEEFTPDEFIAFKIFLIIFFPIVCGVLKAAEVLDLEMSYILGSGVLGWFYPDLWINGRISRRQLEVRRSMPFIVDLLALSTEAGLDFIGAIGKVVEKAKPSPLVEELAQMLKEIKVGASRQEALREMALRVGMPEVNSFVAILVSADQMGASIGKILRAQSDQIRSERITRAEREGAKAASRVIIPVIFTVLPAVLLLAVGPMIVSYMSGTGGFQ